MSDHSKQITSLNNLITTLYDGENGYKEAADDVDSVTLATKFRQLAQQRYNFGHEIKPLIKSFGGEVDKGGSLTAGLHRVWMDLKTAVTSQDEEAIINECIRGEESAVESYQEALKEGNLTGEARSTVTRQLEKIQETLTDLRKMSTSYANV